MAHKHKISYSLLKRVISVALVLSSSAFAADLPTNPNILQGIQQVQTSVQQLQMNVQQLQGNDTQTAATLQSIQATLAEMQKAITALTPAPVGNVLNTTMLLPKNIDSQLSGQSTTTFCNVNNVSAETRSITIEVFTAEGSARGKETFNVPSRQTLALTSTPPDISSQWCRFTVNNGIKTDIVASLDMYVVVSKGDNIAQLVTVMSVPAR